MSNLSAQEALLRILAVLKGGIVTGSITKNVRIDFTRAANTNTYSAGDAVVADGAPSVPGVGDRVPPLEL